MLDSRSYPFTGHNEGKVLKAYRCPAGVITIGYGFTMGSKIFADFWRAKHGRALRLGDVISADDAFMLLKRLMDSEYGAPVEKLAVEALPHQKGAAVDMLFNCGLGASKWRWFDQLAQKNPAQAARLMRTTAVTAKGRRLPGLVRRRQEAADIMEFNRWPSWVKTPADLSAEGVAKAQPSWRLESDDLAQGAAWLEELGYLKPAFEANGSEGFTIPPSDITDAVRRFQSDHRQLTIDGIFGRATLDQLQRVIDLKRKAKNAGGGGAVVSGAGAADKAADASGYADWALYGGIAFALIGCAVLAFLYRDELKIALNSVTAKGKKS